MLFHGSRTDATSTIVREGAHVCDVLCDGYSCIEAPSTVLMRDDRLRSSRGRHGGRAGRWRLLCVELGNEFELLAAQQQRPRT
jgi:hypothetical protein